MLEYITKHEKPLLLVVTPLGPNNQISKETKRSIKRNEIPYTWVSYKSANNCATNAQLGINAFFAENKFLPPFFLLLDDSVICGRHMLDRMFKTLEKSGPGVAYCYCNFEFKGAINNKFPADDFDVNRLIRSNYISSNSMIKTRRLNDIGWLVTDEKYHRLLDWCLWLKFLQYGFIGIPCKEASFVDIAKESSVSVRSLEDYRIKYKNVIDDFVKPILRKSREEAEKILTQNDIIKLL